MKPSPFISAVVFAYNGEQFLEKSIESVLHQTLERDKYEIVIITNFEIPEELIRSRRKEGFKIKSLLNNGSIGEYILLGFNNSEGEVISFLDYDDEWELKKLEAVYDAFKSNDNLVYYNNDHSVIDKNGKTMREPGVSFQRPRRKDNFAIYNESEFKEVMRFTKYYGHSKNSTISIRKSILQNTIRILPQVLSTEDEFFFYAALNSGGLLVLDSQKLTRYRIHQGNKSAINSNFEENLARKCKTLNAENSTFELLTNMYSSSSLSNLKQCIRLQYVLNKLLYSAICDKKVGFNQRASNVISIFRISRLGGGKIQFYTVLLALSSFISAKLSKKFYLNFGGFKGDAN